MNPAEKLIEQLLDNVAKDDGISRNKKAIIQRHHEQNGVLDAENQVELDMGAYPVRSVYRVRPEDAEFAQWMADTNCRRRGWDEMEDFDDREQL